MQRKRQQISKRRNSGFWVAPKIYFFGAAKTLDRITERGYNNVHQVRRTHKNAEGEIKMEKLRKMTQQEVDEMCKKHEAWLASGRKEGERADFCNADLGGARLEGVNLKAANLNGANLEKAKLKAANLNGAFLNSANLKEVSLERADLRFVRAMNATFDGASLEYADFQDAMLTASTFKNARLASANFENAYLGHVNFTGATLWDANFAYAHIGGCHFREASIGGAKWTSIANGDFDDYQIKEFAYQLCWAALAASDTSEYVKDEIRKIVRLANCSNSAKEWGRVQEWKNGQYVTAKEV